MAEPARPRQSTSTSPPENGNHSQGQHVIVNESDEHYTGGRTAAMMPTNEFARVWNLRKHAQPCYCPNCGQTSLTNLEYVTGRHTHIMAIIFTTFCCCFIPYITTAFKDVVHTCGNCGTKLAVWRGEGRLEMLVKDNSANSSSQPTGPAPAPAADVPIKQG
ncbi:LITAF-like zinc ribbon domain-containing protein [Auriculariales sp. MPI-PUGE-AT-0066]|nr:LITAF-like zinc ribbon domain-containing protein [Auriculariales sp. MPI-PUGE-AT-0066]